MAQTTKEATRLVYVEGIDLQNALKMSSDYPNIIFLTDNNKKSNQLESSEKVIDEATMADEEGVYTNDNWDLGLNIVRNGHRYIVVRGINNEHCTFSADGTKYTLRIDQHGLLYLDQNEISERFIYIGKKPMDSEHRFMFDVKAIKDAIENGSIATDADMLNVKKSFIISQTKKETGNKVEILKFLYLVILQHRNADNNIEIFGYLWLFSDIKTLREATQYNEQQNGTVIGPYANQNMQGWSTTQTSDAASNTTFITPSPFNEVTPYLQEYGLTSVFGIDMFNTNGDDIEFWESETVEPIYMLLPLSYEDIILVTNTFRSNRDENTDEGVMLNNHLIYPFELQYYKKDYQNPITVDYNKSQYNIYQFEDYRIRSLGFTVKTN